MHIYHAPVAILVCATLLATTEADAQRRPLASEPTAAPRPHLGLSLQFNFGRLEPTHRATPRVFPTITADKLARIEASAKRHLAKAEGLVRRAYSTRSKGLLAEAHREYGRWDAKVKQLIRGRALKSPVYKEWSRKTWEAQLVQMHAAVKTVQPKTDVARALQGSARTGAMKQMLGRLHQLSRNAYDKAVLGAWDGLYGGARPQTERALLRHNPLALLGTRVVNPAVKGRQVRYRPPENVRSPRTWQPKTYKVGTDLAFVWVPGVHRTHTEFELQIQTLLENGVLGVVSNTGSWRNPFRNAYDIAEAVNKVRKITKNPNVKVVLVGYSQGNTSTYAFLQAQGRTPRERAMFEELRKNVVMVHDLNSAARGTPVADMGVAMTKVLTGRSQEVKDIDATLANTAEFFGMRGNRIRKAVAGWVGRNRKRIDKTIKAITGRNSQSLASRVRARVADKIHDALVGSLESLTTDRGHEVMSNPRLQKVLSQIPVINSVGVVPKSRAKMVPIKQPLDQRPGWQLMQKLGMANDYQVPEKYQRLEPVVRGAVDLPTQAVGHWGITGVKINKIHDERHYSQFSPELHTFVMLQQVRRMGL